MRRRASRFPLRVENLLSEAGGSAYAWYEEELEKKLDPSGTSRKRSDAIEIVLFFATLAASAYSLSVTTGHPVLAPGLVVIYALTNWVVGRGFFPAPWKLTLLLSALLVGSTTTTTPAQGIWVAILLAGVAFGLSRNVMHLYREASQVGFLLGASVAASTVVGLLGPGWTPGILAAFGGAVVGWVLAYRLQGHRAMSVLPVRLRKEQFNWTLPDPPSRLPFLLRRQARKFEDTSDTERKLGARAREDAAIDIKKIGGAGERKTGLLLLGMKRGRWTRILHDVVIPGATQGGNADHVVLARSGGWVLDSKQFGSAKDPGEVRRTNTGEIVHATRRGARDLGQTLRTVAWAVRGIRTEMQVPVRGLLVVHNANVEPGLTVTVPGRSPAEGAVSVDLIAAQYLISYLDMAQTIMSPWEVSAAHWGFQAKLVSATTGRSPQMVAPLGGGPTVMPQTGPAPQEREGRPFTELIQGTLKSVLRRSRPTATQSSTSGLEDREGAPDAPSETRQSPPHAETPAGGNVRQEAAEAPEGTVFPADPMFPGEGPQEMVDRRVQERWEQVDVSEPAAPDDVPEDMRVIGRGTLLSYLSFTEDFSDVYSQDLVALSRPCQGLEGPFVWVCLPAQWDVHEKTGRPVMASTVPLDGVALRPEEG